MSKFPQFLPRHEIGAYPFAGLTTELARLTGAFEAQRAVPYDIVVIPLARRRSATRMNRCC